MVDAITPLLGPLLSAVSAQGHAIMDGLMRELRALAQKYFLSVLVSIILLSHLCSIQFAFSIRSSIIPLHPIRATLNRYSNPQYGNLRLVLPSLL